MSPRSGKARRSRSASPDYGEDPEFLETLRRSKELASGAGRSEENEFEDFDEEADFRLALQLQLAESDEHSMQEGAFPLRNTIGSMDDASRHSASPWDLNEEQEHFARYHTEADHVVDLQTFARFIAHIKSAQCPKCGLLFFRSEHDIRKLLLDWKNGSSPLTSRLTCTKCYALTCLTCTSESPAKWSRVGASGKQITWCCAGGRLLLLWLLLCGVDEHYSVVKREELSRNRLIKLRSPPEKKKKSSRSRPGGIGFGGSHRPNMPSGMGYGGYSIDEDEESSHWSGTGHTLSGHRFDANAANTSGKARALSAQHTEDQFYGLHMRLIEGLLPSFERESSYDFDPPDCVAEMLMESKILQHCAELLRNDSLEDATKRECVYQPLFSLMRTLGAHYVSASGAIYNERPHREDSVNLVTLSFHEHPGICTETTSSLLHGLGNLNSQSEMVLQAAKRNENDFRTEKGEGLLNLCRQISDLHGYLTANSGANGKAKTVQSTVEIPALVDLSDEEILKVHHFSQAANRLTTYTPGRSRRLVTELTTLKTGLPPGIFVRYAESRPDMQKVVIIGPMSTPYENGIFEFDVFCGSDFPNKPPQVQFRTTGGGKVGFNPNLYADGKVCLSLLGTWSGEPWVPHESTLLQVYISIQAMILCDEPWFNEPGRELSYQRTSKDSPSARYNQQIREHTVRTAMLEWLEKTPALWKDVLDQHFTANADKILRAAVEWSKSKLQVPARAAFSPEYDDYLDGIASASPGAAPPPFPAFVRQDLETMLPRLQEALNKYGASKIVSEKPAPVVNKPARTLSSERSTADHASNEAANHFHPTTLISAPPNPPSLMFSSFPPIDDFSATSPSSGSLGFPGFTGGFSYFGGSRGRGGHRGHGYFNPFAGPGRTLGEAPSDPASSSTQSSSSRGRGGSLAGASGGSPGSGRYETRSSARGGGGSSGARGSGRGGHIPLFGPPQGPNVG